MASSKGSKWYAISRQLLLALFLYCFLYMIKLEPGEWPLANAHIYQYILLWTFVMTIALQRNACMLMDAWHETRNETPEATSMVPEVVPAGMATIVAMYLVLYYIRRVAKLPRNEEDGDAAGKDLEAGRETDDEKSHGKNIIDGNPIDEDIDATGSTREARPLVSLEHWQIVAGAE